ncbi:MAG: TraR/DksA C4-type zinc finger protein [Pseudomonadota bacterium]|nr:TraR/DksA C4-type zinc finger protein [Pseudomonadota bacterium]
MLNERELKNFEERLLKERYEIENHGGLTKDDRKVIELDQSLVGRLSRVDAIQRREMALEQERRRIVELKRIDGALERLSAGNYGLCAKCDESISAERLVFDPATTLCITCAET